MYAFLLVWQLCQSPFVMKPSLPTNPSTAFKLLPGEEAPAVLHTPCHTVLESSPCPPPMDVDLNGLPEKFITYYDSLRTASSLMVIYLFILSH